MNAVTDLDHVCAGDSCTDEAHLPDDDDTTWGQLTEEWS